MPIYPTNAAVDNEASASKGDVFVKVGKGESLRVRKLPALNKEGRTVYVQGLHFKLKDPESENGDKSYVHACDKYHGSGDCFMCKVAEVLARSSDPNEVKLTKFPDSIAVQEKHYVPVLVAEKGPDGVKYSAPKLLQMGKSGGGAFAKRTRESQDNDLPLVEDVKYGQDVIVSLPKNPAPYEVAPSGVQKPLEELRPGVMEELEKFDVAKLLECTVRTKDELKEAIRHTLKGFDWDSIFEEAEAL